MSHGKDTKVLVAEYDWSNQFRNSNVPRGIDMAESSTYGDEGKTYEPGLGDTSLTLEAILSPNTVAPVISGWNESKVKKVITRGVGGLLATGEPCESCEGYIQNMDQASPIGDIVVTTIAVQAQEGVDSCVLLHNSSQSGAGDGSTVDQAAASSDGAVGYLHLVQFTGTDITITIQDSPNDSTWADLIDFGSVSAIGSGRGVAVGAVDRYIQAEWSGTFTSATFVVTFARN